ncbi:ABC transporter permease [Acidaminobacter sp. JC074]|uniref:ABC transporter permease n=1 Tax=Acidaminobacter sp. JC074 TaxID=2530199 RepID=UPI001F0D1B27|nr:ABC transporter permease [Acidaminobacter sp. JC074]MCH4887218.1 ABC transporter permease [Acidaminobacter sp. JC074]
MDKRLLTVIKKELKRIFSDRRLIFTTMILPALSIYVMYSIMGTMMMDRIDDVEENIPSIILVDAPDSFKDFVDESKFDITYVDAPSKDYEDQILNGEAEIYMIFDSDFDDLAMSYELPNVKRYYNGSEDYSQEARYNIDNTLKDYEAYLLGMRIGNPDHVEVFDLNRDVENPRIQDEKKATGKGLSILFPMMIAIFLFSGAMSVGPDMIAGEKERGTMATLLVTPVKRSTLAMGKIIALGVIAIITSASSLLGIILSMPSAGEMFSRDGIDMASLQFTGMDFLALIAIMLTLVSLYVAVICLISIMSKTIKEANTYMSPIYMVVMVSGFTTMYTTGPVESWRYFIPVYGSIMALKKLFAFELTANVLLYTCGSSIVIAGILIYFIKSLFNNERVMFNA